MTQAHIMMKDHLSSSQQDDRIGGIPDNWIMVDRIKLDQSQLARGTFLPTMSASVSRMDN